MVSQNSARPYKKELIRAKELQAKGGDSAFDRATLLVGVFRDDEFRADNVDDARAAQVLDGYVEDLALRFLELMAMLKHFSRKSEWSAGRLRSMYEEMLNAKRQTSSRQWKPKSPTQAQATAVNGKVERLEARVESLKENIEEKKAEIKTATERAKSRETELEREVARLEAVAADLTKQLSAKDRELARAQSASDQFQAQAADLTKQLAARDREIATKDRELAGLRARLSRRQVA